KTFEWYRMVSMTPSSQAVEARTEAAKELVASLAEQNAITLLAMVQGIARNFDGSSAEVATTDWLLRKLKQHDPAVSDNLAENKLELRCIAAIALGEFLARSKKEPKPYAMAAAAAFVSAMNMRP